MGELHFILYNAQLHTRLHEGSCHGYCMTPKTSVCTSSLMSTPTCTLLVRRLNTYMYSTF